MPGSGAASERWRNALTEWAIPEPILAAAPKSPWTFPIELFASRADHAGGAETPSTARAMEALPQAGTVLDVGCGAGAASLPLASRASELIGVDTSRDMLAAFEERAARLGATAISIEGRWPEVAPETPVADVTVCNHVFYNAPDLADFARALTEHTRRRVVVELTRNHPQSLLNDLWLRFHGLHRPARPHRGRRRRGPDRSRSEARTRGLATAATRRVRGSKGPPRMGQAPALPDRRSRSGDRGGAHRPGVGARRPRRVRPAARGHAVVGWGGRVSSPPPRSAAQRRAAAIRSGGVGWLNART